LLALSCAATASTPTLTTASWRVSCGPASTPEPTSAAPLFYEVNFHEVARLSVGDGANAGFSLLKPGSMPLRSSNGKAAHDREFNLRRRV